MAPYRSCSRRAGPLCANYGHRQSGGFLGERTFKTSHHCGASAKIRHSPGAKAGCQGGLALHSIFLQPKKNREWIPRSREMKTMLRVPSMPQRTRLIPFPCAPTKIHHFPPRPHTTVIPRRRGSRPKRSRWLKLQALSARRKNRMDPEFRALLSGNKFWGLNLERVCRTAEV